MLQRLDRHIINKLAEINFALKPYHHTKSNKIDDYCVKHDYYGTTNNHVYIVQLNKRAKDEH